MVSAGPKKTLATSLIRISPVTTILPTSSAETEVASARTINACSADCMLPAGTSKGASDNASAMSLIDKPKLVRRNGSTETRSTRSLSPFKVTSATPGMLKNSGATSVSTRSVRVSISSVSLDIAKLTTACASLSARIIATCSTSSGSCLCTRLTDSRTSFAASSKLTPGRNSTRTRAEFSSLCA